MMEKREAGKEWIAKGRKRQDNGNLKARKRKRWQRGSETHTQKKEIGKK